VTWWQNVEKPQKHQATKLHKDNNGYRLYNKEINIGVVFIRPTIFLTKLQPELSTY